MCLFVFRRERSRLMARSQPDLLSIVDDEQLREKKSREENDQDNDNPNKLPPMAKLRTALSNPYVLDIDNKVHICSATITYLVFIILKKKKEKKEENEQILLPYSEIKRAL